MDWDQATIARMRARHAKGQSLKSIATQYKVSKSAVSRHLREAKPASGTVANTPPEPTPRAPARMPVRTHPLPPRPSHPEPSKEWLRAMLAKAVRNTAHH